LVYAAFNDIFETFCAIYPEFITEKDDGFTLSEFFDIVRKKD
jgi:hypothetical protein